MNELLTKHCRPYKKGEPTLNTLQIKSLHHAVKNWQLNEQQTALNRTFKFKNYYQTIAFVNSVAWIAHQEDHHPDLQVSYNQCSVSYSTHSVNGLTDNDFICAAKIDDIIEGTLNSVRLE